jgi:hypothetical protein
MTKIYVSTTFVSEIKTPGSRKVALNLLNRRYHLQSYGLEFGHTELLLKVSVVNKEAFALLRL